MGINVADGYNDLRQHIGHEIECVGYAGGPIHDPANVAVECVTCGEVLFDFDHPEAGLYPGEGD